MRLIDADAFDTILKNGEIEAKKQRRYVFASALNIVRGNLAKQSSVSADPEIIRCKDCKYSRFFDSCFYCYEFGGEIIVSENGFCFMAERRIDERFDRQTGGD